MSKKLKASQTPQKSQKSQSKIISFFKRNIPTIFLLFLLIIFFSFSIILTYDSGHYLGYVAIFEGNAPASSWDIVRGPVFPSIIYLSNVLFGKTSTGILVCTFLFYISFVLICSILCKEIFKTYKHKKLLHGLLLTYLALNPLIFGYFHVLLTEFVAITITMLNILIAYKWIFIDIKNKKTSILYAIYFVVEVIFCWHLKQPYIIIAFVPLIISIIISLINNHKKHNIIYRLGTFAFAIIFLLVSIFAWEGILDRAHVDKTTNRDSSSILGKQLLTTYQIEETNQSSISALLSDFFNNPGKIIKTYIKNYCSLSSICKVVSSDGINYISTSEIDLTDTYENTVIGYAPYNKTENIFQMSDTMAERASAYTAPISQSVFSPILKAFTIPTNIVFKIITIFCLPILVFLIVIKIKFKNKQYNTLFYLNLILLSTALFHLLFSAIAMVIDRYAVEAFTPALLGCLGTITYAKIFFHSKSKTRIITRKKKDKKCLITSF